jgi:DNA-binding response OmpR family regulator
MARIYVIEDEPSLRLLYRTELEGMGHEVTCLSNGREAMTKMNLEQPDLIVLDIMMPEGDGMEFLTRMLDHRMSIPVIINSAYSHYKNDFMSWAAEAYVVKSSDLSELKTEIHRVLDKSQMAMV